MQARFSWIILFGLLGALLLVPTVSAAPTATVYPQAGPPGTRFLFFTEGFAADEPISIWLNAPDGRVIAAEDRALRNSSASGAATWTWTAPSDAPLGAWQMVGHGRRSGNEQVIPFTIGAGRAERHQRQASRSTWFRPMACLERCSASSPPASRRVSSCMCR